MKMLLSASVLALALGFCAPATFANDSEAPEQWYASRAQEMSAAIDLVNEAVRSGDGWNRYSSSYIDGVSASLNSYAASATWKYPELKGIGDSIGSTCYSWLYTSCVTPVLVRIKTTLEVARGNMLENAKPKPVVVGPDAEQRLLQQIVSLSQEMQRMQSRLARVEAELRSVKDHSRRDERDPARNESQKSDQQSAR